MAGEFSIFATNKIGRLFKVPQTSIELIEHILRKSDILLFPFEETVKSQNLLLSNAPTDRSDKKYILFDRNVASDVATLLLEESQDTQSRELALAVVLFMRLCKFTPAAVSALQEFESLHGGIEAFNDAVAFCQTLSAPIDKYLNVLNGEEACLKVSDLPKDLVFGQFSEEEGNFTFSTDWLCSYAATLKLAALERDRSLDKRTKLVVFLNWVFDHFFFTPPLFFVASQFLGARREQSIIKKILTDDKTKLRKQVRNAAWDFHLLLEWHIKFKQKQLCILASRDAALRNIALRMQRSALVKPDQVMLILSEDWPNLKDAAFILMEMIKHQNDLNNPARPANRGLSREHYQTLIASLEIELDVPPIKPSESMGTLPDIK